MDAARVSAHVCVFVCLRAGDGKSPRAKKIHVHSTRHSARAAPLALRASTRKATQAVLQCA
eukprot:6197074-Pleurochrysis_carterae.AAC.1